MSTVLRRSRFLLAVALLAGVALWFGGGRTADAGSEQPPCEQLIDQTATYIFYQDGTSCLVVYTEGEEQALSTSALPSLPAVQGAFNNLTGQLGIGANQMLPSGISAQLDMGAPWEFYFENFETDLECWGYATPFGLAFALEGDCENDEDGVLFGVATRGPFGRAILKILLEDDGGKELHVMSHVFTLNEEPE